MKALLTAILALAILAFLPAPASAQQSGALTVILGTPDTLYEDQTVTFSATVTLVADWTVVTSMYGVPVQYAVTGQPEWANVVVSPASDIFPIGMPNGPQYYATRTFTVTVSAADALAVDAQEILEITATTTPGMGGRSLQSKGSTIVAYDAPEEPCPEHAFSDADLAELAVEAADAYEAYKADEAARDEQPEDVTVQSAGASPVSTGWIAVGGLAIAGAGVGLLLRRRFG